MVRPTRILLGLLVCLLLIPVATANADVMKKHQATYKNRFKARLMTMRSGFVQMYAADESWMKAFYLLGTNADTAGAGKEVIAGGMATTTAEDLLEKGLAQLRALQ